MSGNGRGGGSRGEMGKGGGEDMVGGGVGKGEGGGGEGEGGPCRHLTKPSAVDVVQRLGECSRGGGLKRRRFLVHSITQDTGNTFWAKTSEFRW